MLNQFGSQTTNFGQIQKAIDEYPTITICFPNLIYANKSIYRVEDNDFWIQYIKNENKKETIKIEKLTTMMSTKIENCYKVMTENFSIVKKEDVILINVGINYTEYEQNTPSIKIFFTSEKNAHGVLFHKWMDGDIFEADIKKGKLTSISLTLERDIYLKKTSQCSRNKSFFECFKMKYESNLTNFMECPEKCSPFPNSTNGSCKLLSKGRFFEECFFFERQVQIW